MPLLPHGTYNVLFFSFPASCKYFVCGSLCCVLWGWGIGDHLLKNCLLSIFCEPDAISPQKCTVIALRKLVVLVCLFETEFLYIAPAVRELALVDLAGIELTEILLPLPSECWD